ncbi:hypothetical protein BDY19DRAFT_907883 [Irpex rosettiformis]|uniref:Uncharacterized protein n=1 Tax=Irpex rosettiformis TaxID=378272 RepID=A0ACB8TYE5_9APHY|nr:hypothetical protein BDY19DRAFT_907883 [Irpex rosettiformis]
MAMAMLAQVYRISLWSLAYATRSFSEMTLRLSLFVPSVDIWAISPNKKRCKVLVTPTKPSISSSSLLTSVGRVTRSPAKVVPEIGTYVHEPECWVKRVVLAIWITSTFNLGSNSFFYGFSVVSRRERENAAGREAASDYQPQFVLTALNLLIMLDILTWTSGCCASISGAVRGVRHCLTTANEEEERGYEEYKSPNTNEKVFVYSLELHERVCELLRGQCWDNAYHGYPRYGWEFGMRRVLFVSRDKSTRLDKQPNPITVINGASAGACAVEVDNSSTINEQVKRKEKEKTQPFYSCDLISAAYSNHGRISVELNRPYDVIQPRCTTTAAIVRLQLQPIPPSQSYVHHAHIRPIACVDTMHIHGHDCQLTYIPCNKQVSNGLPALTSPHPKPCFSNWFAHDVRKRMSKSVKCARTIDHEKDNKKKNTTLNAYQKSE